MALARHLNTAPDRLQANQCLGNVVAVIGSTTTAVTTSGTPSISVGGLLTALTAQTNLALSALAGSDLPTVSVNGASVTNPWVQPRGVAGFYVQPANTTVYYVLGANAAGTWKVIQGTHDGQDLTNASGYVGKGASVIPDAPDGFVPVAVIKVASGGATFTVGTTSLGTGGQASGGVATIRNVNVLPVASTF
jgi:hypothetical protein